MRSRSDPKGEQPHGLDERTHRLLLDAAGEVLARDPSASLASVALAARLGRSTLYRYFPTRAQLIHALAMDAVSATGAAIERSRLHDGTFEEALARAIAEFIPMGDRFHFLLSQPELVNDAAFRDADRIVTQPLFQLVERGRAAGALRADLPRWWTLRALEALVYAAWAGIREGDLARREAPLVVVETLLAGVRSPRATQPRSAVRRDPVRRRGKNL